ncbi:MULTISPECIES: Bug family tripartite tricarboxylate transporter substrate binding protein [Bradyrhizobium]|jgi:tripartite-type tricarboxylate transporter receptor subunit TctC|uniref:Tripartite-type tricarboxylate transporter, receptor component TctC n=2 Tax=Bradyrhizobium TaxID=374 RepID=A0ABY0PZ88_9BRAD|nr:MULTISPECIES: tripartite tricarboxylate transporter substrate binding protein [Bradyrhizobium]SDJ20210.1 Tripartite-type tricarboxylate transporter, receptor component TctC [Bradyrhizobium ottawaense]SEC82028.1 Tripartite-type tricarboxylate transporter, receptor component TctC [Bradyrhizobium lablabi]SHK92535.1 Tripartite-type tricarboxylate transporter, receptor component TctC [Bradyrhizobium lablabi]
MQPFCRRSILIACGIAIFAGSACLLAGTAAAENYPSRPVKIVVPFPAGGSNDIVARVVAQKLSERNNGQTFYVENRGGAGGNIGAEAVAGSDPDGYTLLLTAPPPLTINAALYRDLRYDPSTAFAPVGLIAAVPIVLAVHPSTGIKNVSELIALAKAKPGTLFFGSSGNGSTNHLAGELLRSMTGIDIVHVPYKGAAPAMNDLVAGHIPMMFDNIPAVLPQVKGKNINAIAVAGSKRASALPDVPTISESGVPGFEASAWFGLVAPAKTSAPVLAKLEGDIDAILKMPDVQKRFDELGAEPGTVSGAAFGKFLTDETAKWTKIIRESGAKVD